jgi:uncharacterized protein
MMDLPSCQNEALAFLERLPSDDPNRSEVKRIDTHANIIFLVGSQAYKVKRAVKFPFLDYSTLPLREEACKAEITYNKPNAPQIYCVALPITCESDGKLTLNGTGSPVEWVVQMNRFERANELDVLAGDAQIPDVLSNQLADMMVDAHREAPQRSGSGFHAELASYVEQNNAAFREHPDLFPSEQVRHLTETSRSVLGSLHELILLRGEQGYVRRCHGDAHLRNIVLIEDKPVLFDAVEFSDAIATGDILYDLAFLLMDLWERNQHRAANRVFNRYLDMSVSGAHATGLAALPFYLMMRAAIRSKIAASTALAQTDQELKRAQQALAKTYFQYALSFLDPSQPKLVAVGGLSGTGKTTLAYDIAPAIGRAPGARVLRTDVIRKRLLNIPLSDKAPPAAYTLEASQEVYRTLDATIQAVLSAGHSAIYDAVFAAETERDKVQSISAHVEADFLGLWLTAPMDILKNRVAARAGDASDATVDVIDRQLGYDTGSMFWSEIDASGSRSKTADLARRALEKN